MSKVRHSFPGLSPLLGMVIGNGKGFKVTETRCKDVIGG